MTARALVLGVLGVATLAACGVSTGGASKAGAPPGPVVLRLAAPSGNRAPAVQAFADAVKRRSGGRMRVEIVDRYGESGPDAEARVVRGVAHGAVELGWVRSGVLDTLGVHSLAALTAPMLITSYGAEAAVLRSGQVAPMLGAVRAAGVVGLALLADELQRPFGVAGPLRSPGDYRGLVLGAYPSAQAAAALEALGARTTAVWGDQLMAALDGGDVDGFERTLRVYAGDAMVGAAPYATANVVLWPQILVLIANPKALRALSRDQRGWVQRAAEEASAAAIGLAAREEPSEVRAACDQGGRFALATPAQISALRAAFAPLERDPAITRIRALLSGLPTDVPLAIPQDCTGAPPGGLEVTGRATPLDGVYRWTISADDARRHDPNYSPGTPVADMSVFTITLRHQRWRDVERYSDGSPNDSHSGTFRVDGNRVSFAWGNGGAADVFRFRRTPDGLRLTAVSGDPGDLFVWGHNAWRKIK